MALLLVFYAQETFRGYLTLEDEWERQHEEERDQTDRAANEITGRCRVPDLPPASINDCLAAELNRYIAEDHSDQDLQAQAQMAYWAQALFWLTSGTAVISFGGLVALVVSLRQTGRAITNSRELGEEQVRAANQAVVFAQESAKAARDAVSAERAWVIWQKWRIAYDKNGNFGIAIDWHNAGRSPAIHVSIYHRAYLTHPGNESYKFPPGESDDGARAIMGPGINLASDYLSINAAEYEMVKHGDALWLHYCRITYSTVFDPDVRVHTEMCASVDIYGEKTLGDGRTVPDFDMAPVGPQNTAT